MNEKKLLKLKKKQTNKEKMMEIHINPNEILAEMQNRFPKETEICVQAVQIRKMGQILEEATPEDEDVDLKVVEDA